MKYKRQFKESKMYIDFGKEKDLIKLDGVIKGKEYSLSIKWFKNTGLWVICFLATQGKGKIKKFYEPIYRNSQEEDGGSPPQKLSPLFLNIFKIPVPKTDEFGSGLDLNYMVDTLIKKYKFEIIEEG